MNRYPLWKYLLIGIALLFGALYTAPNYFGESPAVQISSAKSTLKVEREMVDQVGKILQGGNLKADDIVYDFNGTSGSLRARFANTDIQFKAKDLLEKQLNTDPQDPSYQIAFNLLRNTPKWLQTIHALPMALGLDLRGGVHFLMQVNTKAVIEKRIKGMYSSARTMLRDKTIYHNGVTISGESVVIKFKDAAVRAQGKEVLASQMPDVAFAEAQDGLDATLQVSLKPLAYTKAIDDAVKQNITTLSKRVNELGVSEPVIQQQGKDRIVVQLPGVQDVNYAKRIIGRTATLEVRLVDETIVRHTELTSVVPSGSELFKSGKDAPVILYKEPIITGDSIASAQATIDQQNQGSVVSVELNAEGGNKMRRVTAEKIGKLMSIVLFEKGKGEVISVATIQGEFGSHFQISGMGTAENSNDLALLLRAGSLAAPMEIIEERTIGPALGAENIAKGFNSTLYGFVAIAVFMMAYYMLFGAFSVMALAVNVLLLIAMLSGLQATLTLPGIAAIALALGMAIDANVLINERIREELRAGNTPQAAIAVGFERAWATILDSNVTTLIVGLALLIFGSGAVRGFAVVHCLGICTSIFSAVFVSRGVVNLWYGRKKKLTSVAIGQIWKPGA
jgi:preprotein translocase subunit SecD